MKVGDKVVIKTKPSDRNEGPGWISGMDQFLGKVLIVTRVNNDYGYLGGSFESNHYTWLNKWVSEIPNTEELLLI